MTTSRKTVAKNKKTLPPPIMRGSALARAIEHRASDLGLSQKAVAKELQFSEGHFALLLNGTRWFGTISEDKFKKIADFLDVPVIEVYMLAEVIYSDYFFRSTTIEKQIDLLFESLQKDSRYSVIRPARKDWDAAPLRMRLLCAILYQTVSGQSLLDKFRLIEITD